MILVGLKPYITVTLYAVSGSVEFEIFALIRAGAGCLNEECPERWGNSRFFYFIFEIENQALDKFKHICGGCVSSHFILSYSLKHYFV